MIRMPQLRPVSGVSPELDFEVYGWVFDDEKLALGGDGGDSGVRRW
jgi:hypothetical protein